MTVQATRFRQFAPIALSMLIHVQRAQEDAAAAERIFARVRKIEKRILFRLILSTIVHSVE
jgi:hypothetical protein